MFTSKNWHLINKVIRLRALSFRHFALVFFFANCFGLLSANAQKDLLVTQAGEEIRCRILDETPTRFVYAYIGANSKVLRTEIFKNLVKDFKYNMYDADLVEISADKKKKKAKTSNQSKPKASKKKGDNKGKTKDGEHKKIKKSKGSEIKEESEIEPELALNESDEINSRPEELLALEEDSSQENVEVSELEGELDKAPLATETAAEAVKETQTAAENKAAKTEAVKVKGEYENYMKWRVGVKGGIGNIRDKFFTAVNEYDLYKEKLMKGRTFGADIAFFPRDGFGIGLVYTDFKSNNEADNLTYINQLNGAEITGSITNSISRKFIGPAIFLRKSIDFKTFAVLGLSPGVYFYSDKGSYNGANFDFKGQDFGGAATLGLDFLLGNDIIGRDIILSLEAGYNLGKLNSLDYGDGNVETLLSNPISLERLDFSVGLRFMRFPRYFKK